jgi:DNA processing protein
LTTLSSRDDVVSWLRLTLVPGVSGGAQRALITEFRTPQAVLDAPAREIARVTENAEVASLLAAGPRKELLDATLAWLEGPDCHLLTITEPRYPQSLLTIHDPPCVLYVRGRIEFLNAPAFAIVGSRNATTQGMRDAEAFALALSQAGFCIVSGLALGIDASAHRGGLAGAGSSIAVMGTGPDRIYPKRNHALAHALAEKGCLVSEFPLGTAPLPENFPRRNRLISGLARGVLVVEAGLPSGSLTTAKYALDQARDVFAIPGSIHSPLTKGCHWLIKEGAKLVESASDVLEELGCAAPKASAKSDADEDEAVDPLLDAMGFAPISMDQIAERTGLGAAKLAAQLSRLEIEGRVAALAGGWFQRTAARVIE